MPSPASSHTERKSADESKRSQFNNGLKNHLETLLEKRVELNQ
jgi:hypothetical protein